MTSYMKECISDKVNTIVKKVDKVLLAERIAIEIKAHFELNQIGKTNFNSFLEMARDEIYYSEEEQQEILSVSKEIVKKKYKIKIVSENPLKCVSENESSI